MKNRRATARAQKPATIPLDRLSEIPNPSKPSSFNGSIRSIPAPGRFMTAEGTRVRPPSRTYKESIGRAICERLMRKQTLVQITNDPRMPSMSTLVRWLAHPGMHEFREMYYYARRVQAEILIDEIITIADDTSQDWKIKYNRHGDEIGVAPDNEAIQRSRVRIDTRKWFAAKMVPRIYGDKAELALDVTGDLAELLKKASNNDAGLPPAIEHE